MVLCGSEVVPSGTFGFLSGTSLPSAEADPTGRGAPDAVIELSKSSCSLCKTGEVLRFGGQIFAARGET